MFTALDAPTERLDKHEQNFVEKIRNHGWFGTHVMPDSEGPGFIYTTGFWLKFGFPEVILFSMRQQTAQDTFWTIYQELDAGRRPPIGEPTDAIFQNAAAIFLLVSLQSSTAMTSSNVFNSSTPIATGIFLGPRTHLPKPARHSPT